MLLFKIYGFTRALYNVNVWEYFLLQSVVA